ncbi:MAG TPA: type II secretion system F family protein [Dermatophilaceae bacterium]|nr:type II secretion system F family protein [Dermatophilaceae bacterium]
MPYLAAAVAAGLVFAAGVMAIVVGLTGRDKTAVRRRRDWPRLARRGRASAGVVAAAGLAWLSTGWPVAAAMVVATVWLVPETLRQAARQRQERAVLEATRAWLQQLATTVAAGVGLESALRETARQTRPDSPIAAPLRRCVEQLNWMDTEAALKQLAADLDNHVGDAATVVLASALNHSAKGLRPALRALVEWADDQLDHLRQVEVEARGLRMTRRAVLGIWMILAVYLAVTSPDLMAAYATAGGQLVLLLLATLASGALWLLVVWSRVPSPERFLQHERADR